MLCALATLVAVPVLMSTGASSDEEVATIVVPDTVSEVGLDADVDIDELFDAGANLDDVPAMPVDDNLDDDGLSVAVEAVAAAPQSLTAGTVGQPRSGNEVVEAPASDPQQDESSTIEAAPEVASERAPAAPTPPTTEPAAAASPATEAPAATEAPTTTEAPEREPVVESPQSAEESEVSDDPGSATPTAAQWAALRQCEASGSYSIVSGNGLYHGAYQFYQQTWDGLANQAGRSDLVGVAPSEAAPADQDALALLLWQQRGTQPWPHCGAHLVSDS